ncbi:uncharacterized protein BX663DRAFT_484429 [Cokeromyces recurvatus]|uniref:uncharacterized protein n=1 Tax=Cokeromyces recurvatus TaxID=90255 RepID=UPI00221F4A70|nr:uncharacterized protein BX663DRAFT_484429 [Cokeromyces recurvatus]KAI7905105.1 hypothetical protein BX663DRAFT_484429 [Cokeromyces recurvatus]
MVNEQLNGIVYTLKNNFTISTINGNSKIEIKDISKDNDMIAIKSFITNGYNNLKLPSSFDSKFKLELVLGIRTVMSTYPQNIHCKSSLWRITKGYYGDNEKSMNSVIMLTVSGSVQLNYV